jgi:glutaredoxin 3
MKNVTIYTTNTCHFCHLAKDFFAANNVAYTEKNVENDIPAQREMIEKTGQFGVPVIELTEEGMEPVFIIGFDRGALVEQLGIAA